MTFAREHDFDLHLRDAAHDTGVPEPLIRAVIAQESRFNPRAYRVEAKIGDASRGLMQLLEATARGLGYKGDAGPRDATVLRTGTFPLAGLFDPATNIRLGTALLADLLRRTSGEIPAAVSAYNGGYRPTLAFGARNTRAGLTICLARDAAGKCTDVHSVPVGEFGNQRHVDAVMKYFAAYGGTVDAAGRWAGAAMVLPAAPTIGAIDLSGIEVPDLPDFSRPASDRLKDALSSVNKNLDATHNSVANAIYIGIILVALALLAVLAHRGG